MCDIDSPEEAFWLRKILMRTYGKWIEDTLDFYLFLGRVTKIPIIGPVVRFFARQYGRYHHGGYAATVEECLNIIDSARQVSVMDCACRVKNGRCDNPVKTCITVNTSAEVFSSLKNGEIITKDKASEIVVESYSNGMIRAVHHCIAPNTYAICNCCTCCCVPYRLRMEFGIETAVENGAMVAKIDRDKCKQCGNCVRVCPQKALNIDTGTVSSENCLGCGLCIVSCRFDALHMVKRDNPVVPVKPGTTEKFLIYAAFIVVIFPLAAAFKLTNSAKKMLFK